MKHDKVLCSMKGHSDKVRCCKISDEGSIVVSGDASRKFMSWDVQKGTRLGIFGEIRIVTEE